MEIHGRVEPRLVMGGSETDQIGMVHRLPPACIVDRIVSSRNSLRGNISSSPLDARGIRASLQMQG